MRRGNPRDPAARTGRHAPYIVKTKVCPVRGRTCAGCVLQTNLYMPCTFAALTAVVCTPFSINRRYIDTHVCSLRDSRIVRATAAHGLGGWGWSWALSHTPTLANRDRASGSALLWRTQLESAHISPFVR